MDDFNIFYKKIVDLIDSAQNRGVDIAEYVKQMSEDLDSSSIGADEIERQRLDSQIDATYEILVLRHEEYTTKMLEFVFKLQQYVDNNYSSVNDFLRDNSIQVKIVFADMSGVVGYQIDSDNIEGNIS